MRLQLTRTKKRRRIPVYSSSQVDDNKVLQSVKKEKINNLTNFLLRSIDTKDKNLFKSSCLGIMSSKKLYCN